MAEEKTDFMQWLDQEVARRGRVDAVAALLHEMRVEEQLADLRRRRGLTQAQLAERMGVKQPLIARLESGGSRNVTLKTIMKAALILGAEVELRITPRSKTTTGERKRTATAARSNKRSSRRRAD